MTAIIGKWAFSVDCFDQGEPRGSSAKHVQTAVGLSKTMRQERKEELHRPAWIERPQIKFCLVVHVFFSKPHAIWNYVKADILVRNQIIISYIIELLQG